MLPKISIKPMCFARIEAKKKLDDYLLAVEALPIYKANKKSLLV
jgi:hypothetical protein